MKINVEQSDVQWAYYKRRLELYMADPNHNSRPVVSEQLANKYRILYRRILENIYAYMDERCAIDKISNGKFCSWYQRQNARIRFQSSILRHMEGLYYIPVSFELSEGCSVGCDFCCLAAESLKAVYQYNEEHADVWIKILKITKEILGEIAGAGLCYFATEPFDNPDYEKFLLDYQKILGCIPQTTTAVSHRNIARTKRFLESLGNEELAHAAVRFSITSLEQLEKIYLSFTPEELYYVELLFNNPESGTCYSKSGKARALSKYLTEKKFLDSVTSICTNGFVVNMVSGTVMLVAACRPDEKYPKGMKVFETKKFKTPEEYRGILLGMINKWMWEEMPLECPLPIADYISYEWVDSRIKIMGDRVSRSITVMEKEKECLCLLLDGKYSVRDILKMIPLSEYERMRFIDTAKLFYESGYLDENKNEK